MTVGGSVAAGDDLRRRLDEVIDLSHRYGRDPEFARGGGGNSSVKAGGVLYIKPSGTSLATLTAESLIALDLGRLQPLLDRDGSGPAPRGSEEVLRVAATARLGQPDARRPSVELLFHALLPERFVLHTHPTSVNWLTCGTDGAALTAMLLGDDAVWIPYTDPGLPLALVIRDARRTAGRQAGTGAPRVYLLQNHGLIVTGDSPDEIVEASSRVVSAIEHHAATRPAFSWGAVEHRPAAEAAAAVDVVAPMLRALLATGKRLRIVTFDDSPSAVGAAGSVLGLRQAGQGPLTPDQIVYTGSAPLVLDSIADFEPAAVLAGLRGAIERSAGAHPEPPSIVLAPGLGLFAVGDSHREADTARHVYLDALRVFMGAHRLGGARALTPEERRFIEEWEAEEYRRHVSAGTEATGRATGLVAIVTGAAQGFGQAIAADLVAEGAHVVLADINASGAQVEAEALNERHGRGRAHAVGLDVTDDASVAAAIHATVERFGGLDLLVSNAGVLRAGSVTSQPIGEFDAVTRVNYRGYFLCVRHVAPVLACQHRAKPDYWGDIVEINSKSGLVGSSRNSAYAGSKFGGIGLTQSFALELVGDGIKVNAICPGNFLDGPLWSDPETGLFVQYLREGKVPGATTVADVRHAYEARVPMGRGCTPADVMQALYYLIAQQYETGQALPVTGGQVMLS